MKPIYQITVPSGTPETEIQQLRQNSDARLGKDYHVVICVSSEVEQIETKVQGDSFTKELYDAKHTLDNLIAFFEEKKEGICQSAPYTDNEKLFHRYSLKYTDMSVQLFNAIDDYFNIKFPEK